MNIKTKDNLLIQVEKISFEASKCKMDFDKMKKVKSEINNISDFLGISSDHAILFSCLTELSISHFVSIDDLAKHLKCSALRVLPFLNDIEELEKKSYIERNNRTREPDPTFYDIGFSVPSDIIESLRLGILVKPGIKILLSLPGLLSKTNNLLSDYKFFESKAKAINQVSFLINANTQEPFVKMVRDSLDSDSNRCVVLLLAYNELRDQSLVYLDSLTDKLYGAFDDEFQLSSELARGESELLKKDLVDYKYSGFKNELISLSAKSLEVLYKSYPELAVNNSGNDQLIKHSTFTSKKLYFNNETSKQLNSLTHILGNQKFNSFQKELKASKLSSGLTILLHGPSGTGKTEFVFQVAQRNKRDIIKVDLSQTKSMWYGESEKQIQKIFSSYNLMLKRMHHTPILFINEVDGLLSKRLNLDSNSRHLTHTENRIQNILLQALEDFKGILLATSNFAGNLDKAFERRFLMKIHVDTPDAKTRLQIWKSKMPELTPKMAQTLGAKYDFTGAQIDNMVKQLMLQKVLSRDINLFDTLLDQCEKENGFSPVSKIGF